MIHTKSVQFYANTPDDTHCYQACVRMVIKYFDPVAQLTWDELDDITHKPDGLWTWPMAGMTWLIANGYDVINIENFDYSLFIADPVAYMTMLWGEDIANEQALHSNIAAAQTDAKEFIKRITTVQRAPSLIDLEEYLQRGYLVICMVNSRILNSKSGYSGHAVLVIGSNGNNVVIHDPGSPAHENQEVAKDLFLKAWSDPNETARNICAIKRQD